MKQTRIQSFCMLSLIASLVFTASNVLAGPGHTGNDKDTTRRPGMLFSELLPDVPGKRMTVVELNFKPASKPKSYAHRHPGSVLVYVTKGTVRFGIEGQGIRTLQAGDTFFEPPGVLHTIAENASSTKPASAIAIMIVPEGASLVTPE